MSICKECGSTVEWVRGKKHMECRNPDGSDHWDKCAQLKMARIRRTGEFFEEPNATGYLTAFKKSGVAYTMLIGAPSGPVVIDKKGCKDCVPPWERCPNRCPIEFATSGRGP